MERFNSAAEIPVVPKSIPKYQTEPRVFSDSVLSIELEIESKEVDGLSIVTSFFFQQQPPVFL